jgi:hypothetical protein
MNSNSFFKKRILLQCKVKKNTGIKKNLTRTCRDCRPGKRSRVHDVFLRRSVYISQNLHKIFFQVLIIIKLVGETRWNSLEQVAKSFWEANFDFLSTRSVLFLRN